MSPGRRRGGGGETIIGRDAVLEGVLHIAHGVRIEGLLRGSLSTAGSLVVGREGEVRAGTIEVEEAIISGRVSGRLRASRRVYLCAGAVFRGVVETPRLVVEEGAQLREEDAARQVV